MKPIKYIKGNAVDALLDNEIDYLLHQVNAVGAFRSGIAGEIRERIPDAYECYMKMYSEWNKPIGHIPLGTFNISPSHVINLVGQKYYGRDGKRYTSYGALASGFSYLETYFMNVLKLNPEEITLGLPKIGCGLGGADWDIVEELIQYQLTPHFKKVIVYEY